MAAKQCVANHDVKELITLKNIAVIGSGISGLTSAYLLSQKHKVTLFEKDSRLGGHTATVDVELDGNQYAVDTGFIVFNDRTYPNFLALLKELGVGRQETEMSFSVHNQLTGLEYNGHNLDTLFAQRRNIFNPKFWGLVKEILRFNKECKAAYEKDSFPLGYSLGQFLEDYQFSRYFCHHYILPMGAAIWSTSLADMETFEFRFFVRFFYHHGLLNIADRPQWYVIPGGSREYIGPLTEPFKESICLNAHISKVKRLEGGVELTFSNGEQQHFDEVVFACHSDQALAMLEDASDDERNILKSMPYSKNSVVLHTDTRMLPERKKAWASWNYLLSHHNDKPASVTYNMNILQGITSEHTFCVTLNQQQDIAKDKILREFTYHHPSFSVSFMQAQQQRDKICGVQHTHFVGAYWYNGFHEDGVRSAVDVAARFDCFLKEQS